MEHIKYSTKLLGVLTLYKPDVRQVTNNIKKYIAHLDTLILWDNSPSDECVQNSLLPELTDYQEKILWNATGENRYIAPAINFAWHYAQEQGYDLLLIMDQDSQWADFPTYRKTIEQSFCAGNLQVYTPYINGFDEWAIEKPIQERSVFINSGTIIPVTILTAINGADESFPLDALDTDLSYRIRKTGYQIKCYTNCHLSHKVGNPIRKGPFHLFTNNYGRERTYSITKCHIMCYRRHRDIMTAYERRKFFKEIFMWKFIRICLVENDKLGRFRMFIKGIKDGITFKF
jgi:rhamnosyltransferase